MLQQSETSGNSSANGLGRMVADSLRYSGSIVMSVEQWIGVRDNPRQRDTAAHAKKAQHLRKPHPTHQLVSMARLPNGDTYKLDGHTRCWLWERGEVIQPTALLVSVYDCQDIGAVKDLYSTFDARAAVETAQDQVSGAMREHAVQFESPMLQRGYFGNAVKRLYTIMYGYGLKNDPSFPFVAIRQFLPELKLLDKCKPMPKDFPSGVLMGALVTLRRRGIDAVEFWNQYSNNLGVRLEGKVDAPQALREYVARAKAQRKLHAQHLLETMNRAVNAYENGFRAGYLYEKGVQVMLDKNFQEYLKEAAETSRFA